MSTLASTVFADLLREQTGSVLSLSPSQLEQLQRHFELLQKWNRVLNLTSTRTVEEIVERHYAESLFLAAKLPLGPLRIADVGAGAGFPGIPVGIVRQDCTVALIESHRRKSVFLREATRGMPNVQVLNDRAEHISCKFDWTVSRGVAFEPTRKSLTALADRIAILGGDVPPGSGFTWNTPIKLPWGSRRYLWIGTVSRETHGK